MEDEQTKEKHWDIRSPTISLVIRNLRSRACLNVTRIKIAVSQIVSDCEEAARRLPVTYTGDDVVVGKSKIGRACGLAANALKARTLLYAASPAYQDKDVIQINGMGNFTVLNEATYQAGWERAALFANEVLKDAGIKLYLYSDGC